MLANFAIDERLLDEAMRLGGHSTREEAVTAALEEYIRCRKQLQILDRFGTVDFDPDYDYKKMRQLDRIEFD
jgi:Arc/MetJ family transcription regulator